MENKSVMNSRCFCQCISLICVLLCALVAKLLCLSPGRPSKTCLSDVFAVGRPPDPQPPSPQAQARLGQGFGLRGVWGTAAFQGPCSSFVFQVRDVRNWMRILRSKNHNRSIPEPRPVSEVDHDWINTERSVAVVEATGSFRTHSGTAR